MQPRVKNPFTAKFEVGIMTMLLKDPTLYDKYYGVWKSEYFHNGNLSSIFHVFERFKETNNEHPTLDTLINFILLGAEQNRLSAAPVEELIDDIKKVYDFEVENPAATEQMVVEWAKQRAYENAVISAGDAIDKVMHNKVLELLEEASRVGAVGFGTEMPVEALLTYNWQDPDADALLNNGWICKGESILLIGQSGVGKSTLALQCAVSWSIGKGSFGMDARRPLRIGIFQSENGQRAMAKTLQGIVKGLALTAEDLELFKSNFRVFRNNTTRGKSFIGQLKHYIRQDKPDMVVIDPLTTFIDGDVKENESFRDFLYIEMSALMEETGVSVLIVHHCGKPPANKNGELTETDLAYSGIGGSLQVNWAREVLVLRRMTGKHETPTFTLTACKRRLEAGFQSMPEPSATTEIAVAHSKDGDCWQQVDYASKQKEEKTATPKTDAEKQDKELEKQAKKQAELEQFKGVLKKHGNVVTRKNEDAIAEELGCSTKTVWNRLKKFNEWKNSNGANGTTEVA